MYTLSRIVFNFIGASIRYCFGLCWRTIANREKFTFNEYLHGPKNSDEWFDQTGHKFVNIIIGMGALVFIPIILVKIYYYFS